MKKKVKEIQDRKKEKEDVKLNYGDICPTCKQPYFFQPLPSYYPQPVPQKKSSTIVILVVIVIIFICLALGACAYLTLSFNPFGPNEDTREFSSEVIIANGGYYKYTLEDGYYDDVKVKLNINLINGSAFDVYIMDKDQVELAYNNQNVSLISFSAIYIKENITYLDDTVKLPNNDGYNSIYLIIDNRNTQITPKDATPTGDIIVLVDLKMTTKYSWD